MLNASVGVQRVLERLRRPTDNDPRRATYLQDRSRIAARRVRRHVDTAIPARALHRLVVPLLRERSWRRSLALFDRLGHERTVAIAVAAIVLVASFLSIGPSGSASAATGGPTGDGPTPRLAVGGGGDDGAVGDVEADYVDATVDDLTAGGRLPGASAIRPTAVSLAAAAGTEDVAGDTGTVDGPFLADGTLLKPVAVDTSVEDGSDLVTTYKVKAGDTLVGIAKAHGVSMMTLWWANRLKSKDDLHRGQILKIPPVSGLVVKVKAGDTLPAIATKYKVTESKILETNEITDPNLVVGQVLIVPGARGKPIATPEPTKSATKKRTSTSSSGGSSRPPRTYSGGNFRWPTTSRHISQYYHYGHYGIDIDGSTGDPIFAAAGGTVTFAGWKSNGGGYQVWIAHGSGLYTTYNHMSSVSVGRGQHVSKGQRVGRMGATGFATGSHLHFEVWKGPIWNGGRRINPLRYL